MGKPLSSLSSVGWMQTLAAKADRALAYAFLSERSQTTLYGNSVTSIPYLIQESINDMPSLTMRVRDRLELYFSRIFDAAVVEVYAEALDPNKPTHVTLRIHIQVTEDNELHSLARVVSTFNGKLKEIVAANNGTV